MYKYVFIITYDGVAERGINIRYLFLWMNVDICKEILMKMVTWVNIRKKKLYTYMVYKFL